MLYGANDSFTVELSFAISTSEFVVTQRRLAFALYLFRFAINALGYSLMERNMMHRNSPVVSLTEGIGSLCYKVCSHF